MIEEQIPQEMLDDGSQRYHVKTFSYREGRAGEYSVMVIHFEGGGNRALERTGYRGEHYLYVKLDSQPHWSHYDHIRFTNEFTAEGDNALQELLGILKYGTPTWDRVQDGVTLDVDDIVEIIRDAES